MKGRELVKALRDSLKNGRRLELLRLIKELRSIKYLKSADDIFAVLKEYSVGGVFESSRKVCAESIDALVQFEYTPACPLLYQIVARNPRYADHAKKAAAKLCEKSHL